MTNQNISIKRIELTSGDAIEVASGVTAIVGPNNTGKSSLLREAVAYLSRQPGQPIYEPLKVVGNIELSFTGDSNSQIARMDRYLGRRPPGQYDDGLYPEDTFSLPSGGAIMLAAVHNLWGQQSGLGQLASYVVTYLNAEGRLGQTGSTNSIDKFRQTPTAPLQRIEADRSLEDLIANEAEAAFKSRVTVNRYAGSMIHLHAGSVGVPEDTIPPGEEYLRELNALPLLSDQGDGMRAFVGMVISVLVGRSPILLIDEPEAFLHPPQARMFGQFLAQQAAADEAVQVIIATHSEDILAGLTSVANVSGKTSIVRLTRDGNRNHAAQLPSTSVQELYEDPLMKHYDMLNGLFSTGVVLCEGDSDCTYYRAVLDQSAGADLAMVREAHFTHAGGKSRISRAITAFRATAVPVAAIFDIDILQNDHEFDALVAAAGADAAFLQPHRNNVISAVNAKAKDVSRTSVAAEIEEILGKSAAPKLSKGHAKAIQEAVAPKSGWKDLKLSGSTMLSGDSLLSFNKISDHLESFGVFVTEKGELERLHPMIPQGNKAEWLRQAIDGKAYEDSPAQPMLTRISDYLESAQLRVGAVSTDEQGGSDVNA